MSIKNLAERQILKAQAEGQLDGLTGEGKPLPPDSGGDTAAAVGFRIMAEVGALPREIALKKQIDAQKDVVARAMGTPDEKEALLKLADLELRHAIEQEARRRFYSTK